ncbi:MAG: DUF4982 domain-containing protein [Clostridiales bacterium]|nr:DUF4982 domain-containing protein [Clostridiales bacterium]
MERLFNDGWRFVKLPFGSTLDDAKAADWNAVDLPHDWLIAQTNDLYETSDGWYQRTFAIENAADGLCRLLRFDGVYMDCDVLVNGQVVRTHRYGYTAFDADLTAALRDGDNTIMVHIRHQSPNTRWYSGAGIFRDVVLHTLPARHIVMDGVYAYTRKDENGWCMTIETELTGPEGGESLIHRLLDSEGNCVAEVCVPAVGDTAAAQLKVAQPALWSCENPNCYTLATTFGNQTILQNVGFRTAELNPDKGLFINGQHVKLHGVCLHQDLGALGSAFNEKAARRQLRLMQEMGVNSLRTSHNPPAKRLMDLCDEMGILVLDELLDMWEKPKTTYDYARFFSDCWQEDVKSWVRRDRNHPSLLMWSIGNEIADVNEPRGEELTRILCDEVRLHDPQHNGFTTFGSNYMPWEGAQNCAKWVDAVGYNYAEKYYEAHHAAHPDWIIYGSETSSMVFSRGIYHFPASANILCDEDLQCSALCNSATSWGTKDLRIMLTEDSNTDFSLGQFLWTGIDYIGEPTPYHTRNSYFGYVDTAGFPKDSFYACKAFWNDEPMVHIGVYWDWNQGQRVDVPVMTNGAAVELFLNGVSLGRKPIDLSDKDNCIPVWQIPYQPGELIARAYDAAGQVIAEDGRHSFGDSAAIVLKAEDEYLQADGQDMTFVEISMMDEHGYPVENAVDRVTVSVTGAGRLMGLDNGDSTDNDAYQTTSRRLFSGKVLAIIAATDEPGDIVVEVASPGKETARLTLQSVAADMPEGVACCTDFAKASEEDYAALEGGRDIPVRRIELIPRNGLTITPGQTKLTFDTRFFPENALAQPVSFRVTNAAGIDSPCATLEQDGGSVTVTGKFDGEVYLRATCNNGYDHPRIISLQRLTVEGMGETALDPYGFVAGGLYDLHYGELGAGNEHGVSFASDHESMAGFSNVDFGLAGSDEMTLPLFTFSGAQYDMELWLGNPREGGEKLMDIAYQKPSIWNVYQPETYKLPRRLTGMQTLCFVMRTKVHLAGFSFARQSRAWQTLSPLAADTLYGDTFTKTAEGVSGIGNNVSFEYREMDFEDSMQAVLVIDGATPLVGNPITIRMQDAQGNEYTEMVTFTGGKGRSEQRFAIAVPNGMCTVTFVFLPGSNFDFYSFRFEKA